MAFGHNPFRFDQNLFNPPSPGRSVFSFGRNEEQQQQPILPSRPIDNAFEPFKPSLPDITPGQAISQFGQDIEEPEDNQPAGTQWSMPDLSGEKPPTFPIMSKYMEALQDMPQRQDYKPGLWSNIFGAIGGVGAGLTGGSAGDVFKTTEGIRQTPFNRALGDWERGTKGLAEAADLETKQVQGKNTWLTLMGNLANQRSMMGKREADVDLATQRVGQGQQRIDIAKQKQVTDAMKAQASGKAIVKANGRVYAWDKATNDKVDLGEDTGITLAGERVDVARYVAETGRINAGTAQQNSEYTRQRIEMAKQMGDQIFNANGRVYVRNRFDNSIEDVGEHVQSTVARGRLTDQQQRTEAHLRLADLRERVLEEDIASGKMTPQQQYNFAVQQAITKNPYYASFFDDRGNLRSDADEDDRYLDFMNDVEQLRQGLRRNVGLGRPRPSNAPAAPSPNAPAPPGPGFGGINFSNLPK